MREYRLLNYSYYNYNLILYPENRRADIVYQNEAKIKTI